jgi:hypothetical protein
LRWRSLKVLLLPGAELLCRLLMLGAHIAPRGLFFGLVRAVPCRPVGIIGDMALPLHPLRRKIGAPIAPGIGIDRQMRARGRPTPQRMTAAVIAATELRHIRPFGQINLDTSHSKHRDQSAIVIGVGITRIAHQIGRIGPRVIVVRAVPPGDRLADHARAIA